MNKIILLLFCFCYANYSIAQVHEFIVPKENDGFYDKKVMQNDSVFIHETEAHILSVKTYQAYQLFKLNYLTCLEERENDIVAIENKLTEFGQSLDKLITDLEKQDHLSQDILKNTEIELGQLLNDINADIHNLNGIQKSIDEADQKLQEIEKKLKKERTKLFWRRIGDLVVAGGIGILIGAAFFGG